MPEKTTGIHLEKAAGQTYTISIPHRYTQGEQVPLILMLHWGGRKYRYIGREILEQLGLPAYSGMQAIMVAPDRKRKHWATPHAGQDIAQLVKYLDAHYNLHPTQRAVVGFSIGGMGVWYLGSEHPELFTCGVAIAAPIPPQFIEQPWNFPIYAIHSETDEVFPEERNAETAAILVDRGAPVAYQTFIGASHEDVRAYIPAVSQSAAWITQTWGE